MSKGLRFKITLLCCTPALLEQFQTQTEEHLKSAAAPEWMSNCPQSLHSWLHRSQCQCFYWTVISNVPSTTNSDKWHDHKWATVCKNGRLPLCRTAWMEMAQTVDQYWDSTVKRDVHTGLAGWCLCDLMWSPADGETPQDFLAPFKPSETEMTGATRGKWLCESSDEFFLLSPVSWIHFWTAFCETVILRDEMCSAHIQAASQLVCCVSISLCL